MIIPPFDGPDRTFTVKVDDASWTCRAAALLLDDAQTVLSKCNCPVLTLTFLRTGEPQVSAPVAVHLAFQRQRPDAQDIAHDDLATGFMDTRERWTSTYGAEIELSHGSFELASPDWSGALAPEDRVRVAAGRRIRRMVAFDELDVCQCQDVVCALRALGVTIEVLYRTDAEPVNIDSVTGRGANARASASDAGSADETPNPVPR